MTRKERMFTVELAAGAPDDERSRLAVAYVQSIMDKREDELAAKLTESMIDLILYGSYFRDEL